MKSGILESRRYIECDCASPEHLLVVDILEEDDQPDGMMKNIYIADFGFMSNYRAPWHKRIYYALKYIFVKQGYYVNDSICLGESNIEQFEELIERIKKQKEK